MADRFEFSFVEKERGREGREGSAGRVNNDEKSSKVSYFVNAVRRLISAADEVSLLDTRKKAKKQKSEG